MGMSVAKWRKEGSTTAMGEITHALIDVMLVLLVC